MEIVLSVLPELVALLIAVAFVVARTTDTAIDNKLAKLAQENKGGIVKAIRSVLGSDAETRAEVRKAAQRGRGK